MRPQFNGKLKTARLKLALCGVGLLICSGCSSWGVKPWDRDLLAKPEMALVNSPIEAGLDDHIYFSKESTSGGRSFAGGGCGCN